MSKNTIVAIIIGVMIAVATTFVVLAATAETRGDGVVSGREMTPVKTVKLSGAERRQEVPSTLFKP